MNSSTEQERRSLEQLDRQALALHQLDRLNRLLKAILPGNRFYAEKLAGCPAQLSGLDQLATLPLTDKDELAAAVRNDSPANLTYGVDQYVRYHQTSGTRGRPLPVLDTADDWRWFIDTWQYVLDAAQVTATDRAFLAFSFGPFIGFWSAHDALIDRGTMVISGGGTDTLGRLERLAQSRATVLLATPTYALHLAQVAADRGIDLRSGSVRRIIVAGEPGGSVPATRERIEAAWDARVIDHAGASEIGPWGYTDAAQRGLHVTESEFIAEFLPVAAGSSFEVDTDGAAGEGELAELVLTTLGRYGAPVIRYRTGDLVKPVWTHNGPVRFVLLEGGVLGRADDMMIIRGVNIFPSSIEQIVRSFPEIDEFRLTATRVGEMDQLAIEIEDRLNQPERLAAALRAQLGLKVDVRAAPLGSLPRGEGKSQRFVDRR